MQFPKTIPYKSTPNSPTSKKVPRPEIKVTKTDNILTIRKKKLDALKEKVTKKWYFLKFILNHHFPFKDFFLLFWLILTLFLIVDFFWFLLLLAGLHAKPSF